MRSPAQSALCLPSVSLEDADGISVCLGGCRAIRHGVHATLGRCFMVPAHTRGVNSFVDVSPCPICLEGVLAGDYSRISSRPSEAGQKGTANDAVTGIAMLRRFIRMRVAIAAALLGPLVHHIQDISDLLLKLEHHAREGGTQSTGALRP